VKRGDTLFSISRKYHVPVDELRRINNLDAGTALRAGYMVRLPRREGPKAREAAAPEADRILFRGRSERDRVHPRRRRRRKAYRHYHHRAPGAPVLSSAQGIVQRIGECGDTAGT
jgi:murein DD-endopeptidase MepM/ murein hydrolase activator NlpD